MSGLVLSLFPGIGLLDRAFEEEGFCVVRGPDLLWGGDVRDFHPPAGRFDGVIGGPPCQEFSSLAHLVRHNGHETHFGNLIPEYERCVAEAQPAWFVMENVRGAPRPNVDGYDRWSVLLRDSDVGGVQPRVRRISLGLRSGTWHGGIASPMGLIEYADGGRASTYSPISSDSGIAYEEVRRKQSVVGDGRRVPVKVGGSGKLKRSVVAESRVASTGDRIRSKERGGGVLPGMGAVTSIGDALEAQGPPRDFLNDAPFTVQGKRKAIGNGVPLPMGRAIASAVKRATE